MLRRVLWVTSCAWFGACKKATNNPCTINCMKDSAVILDSFSSRYISLFSSNIKIRWKSNNASENSLTSEVKQNTSQLTLGQKVKQTTEDASYLGVIIAGIGITGVMFYAILNELFSGQSPNSVYTEALKLCQNDKKLSALLGEPIKGYGELTARGRRCHVSHIEYEKDGKKFMRMKFYLEGSCKKGVVHLEIKQNPGQEYFYRYLFVDINSVPPQTYIIEDNRHKDDILSAHLVA